MSSDEQIFTENQKFGRIMKLSQIVHEECGALQPRILLLTLIATRLPPYVGTRLRGYLMRIAGLQVGKHTTIMGLPRMYGYGAIWRRLSIGDHVVMNIGCHFDLNDRITLEPHAVLGHEVMLLTTTHHIGDAEHRAGPVTTKPITLSAGAWVGARAIILPGVTVGAGSVVAAGAVVTRDVPPQTLVAGVPARVVRQLDGA